MSRHSHLSTRTCENTSGLESTACSLSEPQLGRPPRADRLARCIECENNKKSTWVGYSKVRSGHSYILSKFNNMKYGPGVIRA